MAGAPATAQDCPTAADLATGIEIELDDGTVEVSRPLAPGVIRTVGTYPVEDGTESYVVDLAQGIYLLMYISGDEGAMDVSTRTTNGFEMSPTEMPPVTPGAQLSFPVASIDLYDGPEPFADTHRITVGMPSDHTIGGCTYVGLEVRYTYDSDPDSTEGYIFFPDLGISYYAFLESTDGQRETYTPVRIGAVQ